MRGGTHSSIVDSLKLVIEQKRTYFLLTEPKSDLNTQIRQKGGHTLRGRQKQRGAQTLGGAQKVASLNLLFEIDHLCFYSKKV